VGASVNNHVGSLQKTRKSDQNFKFSGHF